MKRDSKIMILEVTPQEDMTVEEIKDAEFYGLVAKITRSLNCIRDAEETEQ